MRIKMRALTFEDVLLVPSYSEILPKEVSLQTKFSRNIALNAPLVSAAMDTVTEYSTAIAMARLGGIGIIHKNMDENSQVAQIKKVKKSESYALLPMEYALGDYPRLEMTPAEVKFVKDGRTLVSEEKDGLYAVYSEGVLTGMAEISKSACRMKTWLL